MAVPNTNTFSLNDVRLELGLGATTSLTACFAAAMDERFDPAYAGSKNALLCFRNYGYYEWKYFEPVNGGHIWVSDSSWATARAASSGTLVQGNDYYVGCDIVSSTYYIWRTFMRFDLSYIAAGKTIVDARLWMKYTQEQSITKNITIGTQSDTLVAGDFDQVGSSLVFATYSRQADCGSTYVFYSQASSGEEGTIDNYFGSSLKLCIRENHDYSGGTPISQYQDRFYRAGECLTNCLCTPQLLITWVR